jgi:hypothetical protein
VSGIDSKSTDVTLPHCDIPTEVTCPSEEFVPVIIEGGFSCDTKLSAGKFNQQTSQLQRIVDAFNKSEPNVDKFNSATKQIFDETLEDTAKEAVVIKEISKTNATLTSLGAKAPSTATSISSLVDANRWEMSIFGYKIFNPFDFLQVLLAALLMPFASDIVTFFVAPISGCTINFTELEAAIISIAPKSQPAGIFSYFSRELCSTYVPFVRAMLSMILSWQLTVHVYFEVMNIIKIVTSLGASAAESRANLPSGGSVYVTSGSGSGYRNID